MAYASVSDFRGAARRRLPRFLFDYIDGGSYAETTLGRNVADLAAIELRQRILRDVSTIDTTTSLFGERVAMPVALAPIGLAGMNARRGECQAVRAANAAGVPFTLSTVSLCPIAEVAAAAEKPFWFQLYMIRDRGFMGEVIAEAAAAGCRTLLFTADLPVPGARYRDVHSGLSGAPGLKGEWRRVLQGAARPRWALDVGLMGRPHALGNIAPALGGATHLDDFLGWIGRNFDPSITWRDLDFVRERWNGTFVVKGVLDLDDAREAAALGVDGIVVSNHGGRQLDGAASTAHALPAIADAVGDRITVLADGGVRSGLDVLRLLALGAEGVLLGRAWAWALGAAGERGVRRMLEIIEAELRVAMALTGTTAIADIDRSVVAGVGKASGQA